MTGSRVYLHLRTRPDLRPQARAEAPHSALGRFCGETVPIWSGVEDGLILDLTGTERLYGAGLAGGENICRRAATVAPLLAAGLAATRLAAHLASLLASRASSRSLLTVPPAATARFLALFPLPLLRHSSLHTDRLAQLGVRTLGDLQQVPDALLQAVFGPVGLEWGRLARGTGEVSPREKRASDRELVVGARWAMPLSADGQVRALQRAFALRALLGCGHTGAARAPWELRARWPDGRTRRSGRSTWSGGGWTQWQELIGGLWQGLGIGRSGLTRLELWSGVPGTIPPVQESLFPGDTLDLALAGVLARADGLAPASQVVLASLHIRWYGAAGVKTLPVPRPGG